MTGNQPHRLTKEFLKANTIGFFPSTPAEAAYIQQCLFELDARWPAGGQCVWNPADCVQKGISVLNGVIYFFNQERLIKAIICDVRSLSDHLDAPSVAMQRRIDALEKEIAELKATFKPAKLAKPALGGKGGPQ